MYNKDGQHIKNQFEKVRLIGFTRLKEVCVSLQLVANKGVLAREWELGKKWGKYSTLKSV